MIKNFEEIKSQLKALSEIINGFKSEAVQLRLVELIFDLEAKEEDITPITGELGATKKQTARRRSVKNKSSENGTAKPASPKRSGIKPSGQGAISTLLKLVDDDFFKTSKSINDITKHCDHNLARKFKSRDFSGKLGRLVREGRLKRTKNAENQYEYQNG